MGPETGGDSRSGVEPATAPPVLAGRYRLDQEIGRGGMGVVYRARDLEQQADVALKTLQRLDGDGLYALKKEFRALADLVHPNLVRLGELVRDGEQWFFTMELVDGQDLLQYVRTWTSAPATGVETTLKTPVRFDEHRLRGGLLQLCDGLEALHAAGKIHRDIKPANVLVGRDGRLVLLDFGLATDALDPRRTEDGWLLGTPTYMAPEQAGMNPIGLEVDWYAVGVMLYEMLAGRPPFAGPMLEVLERKRREIPPSPGRLSEGVAPDLDELCMGLLATDPARRMRGTHVRACLAGHGPAARPAVVTSPAVITATPFVGRTRELTALEQALAASADEALTVLIQGESGVGKTALMRQFIASLERRRPPPLVLSGRCYERESVPYKAFDGVVDALSRCLRGQDALDAARLLPRDRDAAALLRIFPVLQRVPALQRIEIAGAASDAHELRRQAFAALRELFSRLADRQPVVLAIDDLQWADADSLVLLDELVRPPDPPRLLVLATVRDRQVEFPGTVREIPLGGLDPDEARALAETLGVPEASAQAVATEAKGHPLFLTELATGAGAAGGEVRLEDVLWDRVCRLDAAARDLLALVTLAGVPLAQRHVAAASDLSPGMFTAHLAELRHQQLVRTLGVRGEDAVECYHDRIRDTILGHLDQERGRRLHARLAAALEEAGIGERQPDILVRQLELAGAPEQAARHAVRAAERAEAALAFEQAADLYRTALRLGRPEPQEVRRLQRRMGDALANAGRGREAADAFREATAGAPPEQALESWRRAAAQLLLSGHASEGVDTLRTVLAGIGMRLPRTSWGVLLYLMVARARVRLRALWHRERDPAVVSPHDQTRIDTCWTATLGLSMIDPLQGALFNARHLLLALRTGQPTYLARALAFEAGCLASTAVLPSRRVDRLLARAAALAGQLEQPYAQAMVELITGVVAHFSGRWAAVVAHCDRASDLFRERCTGVAWEADNSQAFAIWALWFRGQVAELSRRVRRLGNEAEGRGDLYGSVAVHSSLCNVTWLADDDVAEARRHVEEARRSWAVPGFKVQDEWILVAETLLLLYTGENRAAWSLVSRSWRPMQRSLLLRVRFVETQVRHLRATATLAAAGETSDRAERATLLRAVATDARRLERGHIKGFAALATLLRAGVAASGADAGAAKRLLEGAIRRFTENDMALYAAAAKHRLGEIAGGDRGRGLMAEALAFMSDQQIRNPVRMLALLAPGFASR